MIRGLIFDFDGLILDTEMPDFEAWQEMFVEHGVSLPLEAWTPLIGTVSAFDLYDYLEQQAGRTIDRADVQERRRVRYHELVLKQTILPGVEEYIREAKTRGMKVGLASASWGDWAPGHLERLGLHVHFDAIKTAADVERVKPDPALYLAALDALGLDATEAIALEDSPNGIAAAKAAGLFCVAIPNAMTRDLDLSAADYQLTSLADIPLAQLLAIADNRHTKNGDATRHMKGRAMTTTTVPNPEIVAFADPLIAAIERILACLDGLDAEGLNWRPPAPLTNSLYVLAFHTMGSAEAAIIGELGGQHVERDRDAEFTVSGDSAAPLYARWEALAPRLRETLNRLTAADMEKTVHHRRFGVMSGRTYLILSTQHPAEHAGHAELTRDLLTASRA